MNGVTVGAINWADTHDPAVAKADKIIHKSVQETGTLAWVAHVDLHVTDWVTAQQEDLILKAMIEWISEQKLQDLKYLLGGDTDTEEGKTVLQGRKKLTLYQGALYHHHIPAGEFEEVLQFVVPKAHQVTAMNGCHWDAGHQGQQQILCLLHDWFWWSQMAAQMQKVISNCEWCIQYEYTHANAPVGPNIVTLLPSSTHYPGTSMKTPGSGMA